MALSRARCGALCGVVFLTAGFLVQPALEAGSTREQAPVVETGSREAFSQSLTLRIDRRIADSSHTLLGWLAQVAPVAYTSTAALRVRLELWTADATPRLVKSLGETPIYGGDLVRRPVPVSIQVAGVADGDYSYVADVLEAGATLARLQAPVKLVSGLDEKQASFEARLAKITAHDSAKATVRYPFDLARVINLSKRVFGSGTGNPEFGLSQAGVPQHYDFTAGLKHSADVLAALERGRDPVWRSGGEKVRHYYMAEADEILPYRVFVPSSWNGRSALPLVFVLHGNSRDQDYYFDRDGRIIPKTAEANGFMVVAPLGYSPNGGYNYVPYGRASGQRGFAGAVAAPQTFGPVQPNAAGRGGRATADGFSGVNGSVTPGLVRPEWSELDAMHVFDLVRQEYPIDPKRIFLFGYSAGGQGSHYLGPKFNQHWAAIAIGGSNAMPADTYPYERLTTTPMFIFVGDEDKPNLGPGRAMADALTAHGVPATLKVYPGANHDTAPSKAVADIFQFFKTNPRR